MLNPVRHSPVGSQQPVQFDGPQVAAGGEQLINHNEASNRPSVRIADDIYFAVTMPVEHAPRGTRRLLGAREAR
ncbi:MAG: hypothetical protein K1X89_32145 [Myxococcaceae bacterium]|nr:hypothetical protein [Myxococcaceae bacterium]